MRLISRYVVFELLKTFLVTLSAMTVLMILVGVVQEAYRQGLGPVPLMRLVPFVLPDALRFAVPGTILFSACIVYGRMSAANEVMAIRAMGVSSMAVVWPALFVAFAVSLVAVWLNDVAVSWGRKGVHRVVLQSVEQIAYSMLRTHRSYVTDRLSITVMKVEGRRLIRPRVSFFDSDTTMTADEACLKLNSENDTLNIEMLNVEGESRGTRFRFPGRTPHEIPLAMAARRGHASDRPSEFALRQIRSEADEQRETIDRLRQSLAAAAAYQMVLGDFDGLAGDPWSGHRQRLKNERDRLFRIETEPWRRWANGFSCLFFVMVGAPVAIRMRNADFWTSFGLCFLPILLVYYPVLMYGVGRAKCGALPPYSAWLANLLLLAIGVALLRRLHRS